METNIDIELPGQEPPGPVKYPVVKVRPTEPNGKAGQEVSTEITVQGYIATAEKVLALTEQYTGIVYEVSMPKGMDAAKKARYELVKLRTSLESTRTALKAPVIQLGKDLDAQAKAITAAIVAMEAPIDAQITSEEERKKTEREAKARLEQERQRRLRSRVTAITHLPMQAIGKPSSDIAKLMDELANAEAQTDWDEFLDEVKQSVIVARAQLDALYASQVAAEGAAAEKAAHDAELKRLEDERLALQKLDESRVARIRAMERLPGAMAASNVRDLHLAITRLGANEVDEEEFGLRTQEAIQVRKDTIEALTTLMLARKAADEAKAAQDAREAEEAAKREAEADKVKAEDEAKRKADEERQRIEREAQEARDAELERQRVEADEVAKKKLDAQAERIRVLHAHAEELHACVIKLIGICNARPTVWTSEENAILRDAMTLMNKVRNKE